MEERKEQRSVSAFLSMSSSSSTFLDENLLYCAELLGLKKTRFAKGPF